MATRDGIVTDTSQWPVVIHTTLGIPSDRDVDAFVARADALLARSEPHAVIFDCSRAGRITRYLRKRSLEWLAENQAAVERHCVCKAVVTRSAALRFLMTTVMLASRHRVREEVFATVEQAVRWSRHQLELAEARAAS